MLVDNDGDNLKDNLAERMNASFKNEFSDYKLKSIS